ncbi:MAG: penicillin acylase family protein [Pseudomonadota bacterium]
MRSGVSSPRAAPVTRLLQAMLVSLAGALIAAALVGCSVLTPLPKPATFEERLSQLPTDGLDLSAPVTVRWDRHMIPFIEAQTDDDAAFALGLVHAHLRLGQLAVARRIAEGRLSESAGPATIELDRAIRAFDFGRSVDRIYQEMPQGSRRWIDRYVAGINAYADRLTPEQLPHEMKVMDIAWEPWAPQDSLLLGRVSGIDINWEIILTLLQVEDDAARARILARLREDYGVGALTFGDAGRDAIPMASLPRLAGLSRQIGKAGSNSVVVGPSRSASGSPLIANDPHLAFFIPNPWVIVGLRSPSYEIVGMMVPGTPVFGFGRTREIAWGGTNLRATTSELVDVSGLPSTAFEKERQEIDTRFWFDTNTTSRWTAYGPVMSDLEAVPLVGPAFAVRWIGHGVSDEVTALLAAMRAKTVGEFREAMARYAIPSQTFLAADRKGAIASVIATQVPARPAGDPLRLLTSPETSDRNWLALRTSRDLPFVVDPPSGVLASANNRPAPDGVRPYGGHFPQDERVRRLNELLAAQERFSLDDLQRIQMDVVSPLTVEALEVLRPRLAAWKPRSDQEAKAIAALMAWDGAYHSKSAAALIFEGFMIRFTEMAFTQMSRSVDGDVFAKLRRARAILLADIDNLSAKGWSESLSSALLAAAETASRDFVWGDVHRLDVQHIFGNIPVLGSRYRLETIPVPGSQETVFKTAHPLTTEEHRTFFGAQARHLSDLADPDANYFVLLGGQDGWLNSPHFADQVALWRNGQTIQVPMERAALRGWTYATTTIRN